MSPLMQKEENNHHAHHSLKMVFIKNDHGCTGQLIDQIMYITSENGCSIFHNADGNTKTSTDSLDFYTIQVSHYNFVRIHDHTLLNMDYIKEYHKGRGGEVELLNGTILIVSINGKIRLEMITKGIKPN